MDDELFSIKVAIETIDKEIELINKHVIELRTIIDSVEIVANKVLMEHAKKSAMVEKLEEMKDDIEGLEGSYNSKDGETDKKDKKINELEEKIEEQEEILEEINDGLGNDVVNSNAKKEKEKVENRIKKLKEKKGIIEQRQRTITINKVVKSMKKQEHLGRASGRADGYKEISKKYGGKNADYYFDAKELYRNKKYIKGTEKKIQEFTCLGLEKVTEFCSKAHDKNAVLLEGAMVLSVATVIIKARDRVKEFIGEKWQDIKDKSHRSRENGQEQNTGRRR